MLYIITNLRRPGNERGAYILGWHFSEPNPIAELQKRWNREAGNDDKVIDHVIEVQADGDELNHIELSMRGLPFTDNPVQRWFGDHAKFIAANL